MASGFPWRALVLGSALALPACRQAAAEARFAKDFNCDKATTEKLDGGRFRVTGCGTQATYSCVNKPSGDAWDNELAPSALNCTREAVAEPSHPAAAQPAPPRKGSVARLTDAASGARGVTAELPLLQAGLPGPWLRLQTKPGDDPNRVLVTIASSAPEQDWASCGVFALVVNGAAVPATVPQRSNQGAAASIRASYEASTFAPITLPNPTLSVRVCGLTYALPDDEFATLQKFLAIRDELTPAAAPAAPAPSAPPQDPDLSSAAGSVPH